MAAKPILSHFKVKKSRITGQKGSSVGGVQHFPFS